MKTTKGVVIASAVAALFASAAFAGDKEMPKKDAKAGDVKCEGTNSCKGTGSCGGADHSCAGQNSCKGKGWTMMGEKDCKAKGGKVVAEAMKK
jgi:uncharacterized membrane protein